MTDVQKSKDQSVFLLLTALCRSIASQNGFDIHNGLEEIIPKLRKCAYEILLKKSSCSITNWNCETENTDFDASQELEKNLFAIKLNAKSQGVDLSELETRINALVSSADSYFSTSQGNNELRLLLALQNNPAIENTEVPTRRNIKLHVPGPFTLNAPYKNNRFYPKKAMILTKDAEPKYFQSLKNMQTNARKGFVPKSPHRSAGNLLQNAVDRINQSKNTPNANEDTDCTFTSLTRRHICSDEDWLRIDLRSLQFTIQKCSDFYALQMSIISSKPLQTTKTTHSQTKKSTLSSTMKQLSARLIEEQYTQSWTWESIGSKNGIKCAKPFVSDVKISFELQGVISQERKQRFQAKVLTTAQFLRDLKILTVGLQSDTFYLTEDLNFKAIPDITIPNVLPAIMRNYVHEFQKCGSCYKRLHMLTLRSDNRRNFEGFIFKAFCAALGEYLLTFRQFVFAFKGDETLISFYKRMKKAMAHIQNLTLTLGIDRGANPEARLPKGSQFLGYLYREIMRLTDNELITLLMYFLKRCCHVYFKYLQLWIFHGVLDDPTGELFIQYIDHYRENTKYFYDKAYIVRKETVPGFFQNYEDRILQCGKYTMLLRAYNPNHPLFSLECPKISVRLSFEEIQKLELGCAKYAEKARELCGKPITAKDIFEARAKRRNDFQEIVFQRSRENLDRWNLEQYEISMNIAEEKRKRLEELQAQLEEAKQNKIDKRRQSVELELKALREAEKHNEEHMQKENINLRKRIEYYQELSDTLKSDAYDSLSSSSSRHAKLQSMSSGREASIYTPKTSTSPALSFSTAYLETYREERDTDNISSQTECGNKDFECEFAKTADELHAFLEERNKKHGNNNILNDGTTKVTDCESKHKKNLLVPGSDGRTLQRSISDVINSNIPHENDNMSILQLNRLKTLTGTIGLCFDEVVKSAGNLKSESKSSGSLKVSFENDSSSKRVFRKAFTVLSAEEGLSSHLQENENFRKSLPDINLNTVLETPLTDLQRNRKHMMDGPSLFEKYVNPSLNVKNWDSLPTDKPLTELQRNRRRVLTEEYTLREDNKDNNSDIDKHKLPDDLLTDMQRNRRRMMDSPHPFSEYNKPALSERPTLNLSLDTDRSRNRRKVLESEYNIITGDAVSIRDVLTPMSTTSDPPLTEQLSESEQKSIRSDIVNGNLRLNISNLTKTENEGSEGLAYSVYPSTAAMQHPTTPFGALNTAGIRARIGEGFHFSLEDDKSKQDCSLLNLTNTDDEIDNTTVDLHSISPYKWCKELVESKFKCSTDTSIFRRHTALSQKTCNQDKLRDFKIDSLSVITLTEFLQKSIILPMNTHMDIVNAEVMRLLLQDLHLIDHFRSLRNYFFLMDGEFGSIICDGIIGRVEGGDPPIKVLSFQMLHMILDTALSCSIQKDSNAGNLSFIVSEIPSKFVLSSPSVLNVLSLCYRVQWPLNLILNPETLEQYGMIFKHLLKVRRISWVLEKTFEILRQAGKQHGKKLLRSSQYLRIQQIRHKFYHFVHALQHHIISTALQASWKLFKDELIHAKSLEDIYRMHTQYVKRIRFLCMLNRSSAEFNNAIENIFKISLKFYSNLKSCEFTCREGDKEFTHARFAKMVSEEEEFEKLIKYTIYLGNKIVRRGYQAEIGEFITLININKYYST